MSVNFIKNRVYKQTSVELFYEILQNTDLVVKLQVVETYLEENKDKVETDYLLTKLQQVLQKLQVVVETAEERILQHDKKWFRVLRTLDLSDLNKLLEKYVHILDCRINLMKLR